MKKLLSITAIAALGVAGGGFIFHQANGATPPAMVQQTQSLPTVKTVRLSTDGASEAYGFNVRLEPFEEAMIYARANGYVEEWLVDIGARIKKGDVLARLALPELEEQINQVKAEINSQEAAIVLAKTMKDRVRSLLKTGSVSQSEDDQRQADYKVAVAKREALRARLGQLQKEFSYTTIEAPFDGIITMRNLNRGDRITVNDTTPLYRIINADKLRVVANIPQSQLAHITPEQTATLTLAEQPEKPFEVRFWKRSGEVDIATGTMRMEYMLENAEYNLPSGISGQLSIAASSTAQSKWLPVNTIKIANGKAFILAADDSNIVKRIPVVTGRYTGDKVEILSELTEQEKIIINPNALLKAGDNVNIAN